MSASWAACGRAGVLPPASLSTADPRRSSSTAASSSPADGQPTAPRFAMLAARITTFPATKYAGKDTRNGNNVKNERTNVPISFGNETKTIWCRSRICLVENRLFRFGPESALLDQTEISFDGADSGTNSDVLVSFLLDVETFDEQWWNVCSFTVLTLLLTVCLQGESTSVECRHQLCK